jgi:hypothetical protein
LDSLILSDTTITDENLIGLLMSIESAYFKDMQIFKKWAEIVISSVDLPPAWILEIYDAEDLSAIFVLLAHQCNKISQTTSQTLDHTAIFLGFTYLTFKRGDINFINLLLTCGRKTDLSNYIVDCSYFFGLARKMEEINLSNNKEVEIYQEIKLILQPMAIMAINTLPKQFLLETD